MSDEPTGEELRQSCIEAIENADAAFVVAARDTIDEDGDEAVQTSVCRFIADRDDRDLRNTLALMLTVREAVADHGEINVPDGTDLPDGVADLLGGRGPDGPAGPDARIGYE